jgi:hypothetical protein
MQDKEMDMTKSSNTSDRFDVFELITNQIIAAIESGTGDVQMPQNN